MNVYVCSQTVFPWAPHAPRADRQKIAHVRYSSKLRQRQDHVFVSQSKFSGS